MRTTITSLIVLYTFLYTTNSMASDYWSFEGKYQSKEITLEITLEISENYSSAGESNISEILYKAKYDGAKIINPVIIFGGNTYRLKNFVTHKDKTDIFVHNSLEKFDFELKYTIKGQKTTFHKKFSAFSGTYIDSDNGKLYIFEHGKKLTTVMEKLIESRLKMKMLLLENGKNYNYTVEEYNSIGQREVTTITIKIGLVYTRKFQVYVKNRKSHHYKEDHTKSWVETNSQLNSHIDGAKPRTIEQLYDNCEKMMSEKKKGYKTVLKFLKNGIISRCEVKSSNDKQSLKINRLSF
ncbi:hypothetical protein KKF34_04435 [Myxococcota bacterium]|nr:hypothetical protein [Myxococcota bacterium]MBU1379260.1 hypothetical protein [Myxococcota bacterium]MBU1496106.1 hypothetical protein [Myxococcota bacterium]